jgi:hypothetical protein
VEQACTRVNNTLPLGLFKRRHLPTALRKPN